jgi:hypothetical protein
MALALGACSRSSNVTAPLTGGGKPGVDTRNAPVNCPQMIPNTPETAIEFIPVSAACVQFRSGRIRFEMDGDLPSPRIENMGPCVAYDTPEIRFISGHANVFISGTRTSVTENGQPMTFGELLFPGALFEPGIVVASDAVGNVLEVIWPAEAGLGIGQPIIRVQLARWNTALINTSQWYDIEWDMIAERDSVQMHMKGRAERVDLSGSATPQIGAGALSPCPTTLEATSDTVITQFGSIVQFRANRLRVELIGDVASGTIGAMGACAASEAPSFQFMGGAANAYRARSTQSVTFFGNEMHFGPLVFPGVLLEPGVVVASDAEQNVLEIIWPQLAGLGQGPPILRLQMAHWNPWIQPGRSIDVVMRFDALGPDGIMASYTAHGRNIEVPAQK